MVDTSAISSLVRRFAIILALVAAALASPSITYAPAPQVNDTFVAYLYNSTVGSRFIGSKRF